jgi:hypothetical protein
MIARLPIAALVLVIVSAGAGCVTLHGPEEIRRDLSREVGVKLDRDFTITVNRGGMWLARKGLKWSSEDDISLKGVHHVDLGIYEVAGLRKGFEAPNAVHPDYFRGWEPLARVQEEGENVLVLTREKNEKIKGLLVVVTDPEEWVIVRAKGNLNQILEEALAEAFDEIERPDLYQKTLEERSRQQTAAGEEDPTQADEPTPRIPAAVVEDSF